MEIYRNLFCVTSVMVVMMMLVLVALTAFEKFISRWWKKDE